MATLANVGLNTISDVINQYTSLDGQAAYVKAAETLSRKAPLIGILPMSPSNQIMSNVSSRDSSLPTLSTRRFNEGVALSATHTAPLTDPICIVEDYSQVDKALWQIQNDPNRWRMNKDQRKVEAMTQTIENILLYGSLDSDPGAINGVLTRFNSLTSRPNDDSGWPYNVVSAGGSGGDTASVLVMQFGEGKVMGIYPKNLPAGMVIEDLGEDTIITNSLADPRQYQGMRTHFVFNFGIVVEDERYVQRIANIEVSGDDNLFDEDQLITVINNLPDAGADPTTTIFVTRSVKTTLDIRAKDKNNVNYGPSEIWGRNVTHFRGIPVMLSEMMTETETVVS